MASKNWHDDFLILPRKEFYSDFVIAREIFSIFLVEHQIFDREIAKYHKVKNYYNFGFCRLVMFTSPTRHWYIYMSVTPAPLFHCVGCVRRKRRKRYFSSYVSSTFDRCRSILSDLLTVDRWLKFGPVIKNFIKLLPAAGSQCFPLKFTTQSTIILFLHALGTNSMSKWFNDKKRLSSTTDVLALDSFFIYHENVLRIVCLYAYVYACVYCDDWYARE